MSVLLVQPKTWMGSYLKKKEKKKNKLLYKKFLLRNISSRIDLKDDPTKRQEIYNMCKLFYTKGEFLPLNQKAHSFSIPAQLWQ